MTITVTGATGHLGRLVVESLLARGVSANEIVAAVRNPDKASDFSERGVQVRRADYTEPESLIAAFTGTEKLLLISSNEVGQRLAQHKAVIEAAVATRVRLIAYTSILGADTTGMALAAEHKATEELIRGSGIPYVLLRNGWYIENYTENLAPALAHGAIMGSARDGKLSGATRADYAAAAAAVLAGEGHENRVYELGGDEPFGLAELAAEVAHHSGTPVGYADLAPEQYITALVQAGVPEGFAQILADSDLGIARGELLTNSGDLRRLIGRPTTTLAEAVASAVSPAHT